MNKQRLIDTIGSCAVGLGIEIENQSVINSDDSDTKFCELAGFLIGYLCHLEILKQKDIIFLASYFSTISRNYDYSFKTIQSSKFYWDRLQEMKNKEWTLPDKVVYNILNPSTWDNFETELPIGKINFFEIMNLWVLINGFISNIFLPKIHETLNS